MRSSIYLFAAVAVTASLLATPGLAVTHTKDDRARVFSPTQGLIHASPGCGNPIDLTALDGYGRTVEKKVLVKGRPGIQLVPYDTASKPNRLLYVAFDCQTRKARVFIQEISSKPRPRLLLETVPGEDALIGAAWDPMRDAALVLIQNTNGTTQTIGLATANRWTPLWKNTFTETGFSPRGLQGQTGGEFLVFGSLRSDSQPREHFWTTIRVLKDGNSYAELGGKGSIQYLTSTILGQVDAYVTDTGVYVCNGLTTGNIADSLDTGACVHATRTPGYSAVFVWAKVSNHYWLAVEPSKGTNERINISCGSMLLSCGNPKARQPTRSGAWPGQAFVWMPLFDVKVDEIASGRVPL